VSKSKLWGQPVGVGHSAAIGLYLFHQRCQEMPYGLPKNMILSDQPNVRVDLHMHSRYSRDCRNSLDGIIKTCQKKGLNVICVTDHNEIEGALRLRDMSPLPVIVGEEIKTDSGEILAYFIETHIPAGLPPAETIQRIRDQGGVVSIPHPFDGLRHEAMRQANVTRIVDLVDAIEVFNARCLLPSYNREAAAFAKERGLPATAGSDAHTLAEIGGAYLEMPYFSSRDEFLKILPLAQVHGHLSLPIVHLASTVNKWIKH